MYSTEEYDLVPIAPLNVTWEGTASDMTVLNDGINTKDSVNSGSYCNAYTQAKPGFVFGVEQVKIFLNNLNDKSPYTDGNLVLLGSNDEGVTTTELYSFDDTIHEGWNTVDWRDDEDGLRFYSVLILEGNASGACRFGEVKIIGVEVFDLDTTSVDCTVNLVIGESISSLENVVYDDAATPSLTSITPRFGSVLGGEEVTFAGDFLQDSTDPIVTLDNRDCAIDSKTDTEIVCTTSDKPYVPGAPTLSIYVPGYGLTATRNKVYRYVSRWSDSQTWGYDLLP